MKKYILFALTAVVTLCLMSCIDEDDFIQEGNLRVEFTNDIYIRHDEKVTIYVMDIRGNEKLTHTRKYHTERYLSRLTASMSAHTA